MKKFHNFHYGVHLKRCYSCQQSNRNPVGSMASADWYSKDACDLDRDGS